MNRLARRLALETEVESRLVSHSEGRWQLRHGPFAEKDFLRLSDSDWTLLVQAVDLWVPEIKQLLACFDFLPPWRMDDVMVSYATPNGSVGPHFDRYDVFLLQVSGTRQWQLGAQCDDDAHCVEDSEPRVLADFEALQEHVLSPGDMLYLPPRVSHWGVAQSNCLTYSVGFRAPSVVEMLDDLVISLLARDPGEPGYLPDLDYRDPPLDVAMASDRIDPAFISEVQSLLAKVVQDEALLKDWFARYMTAPKYPQHTEITQERRKASIGGVDYINGQPRT